MRREVDGRRELRRSGSPIMKSEVSESGWNDRRTRGKGKLKVILKSTLEFLN